MAQDFRRHTANAIGVTAAEFPTGNNFANYTAVVGIHICNISSNAITVECYINDGTNDIHLVKDAPIPAGGALQILDGGAKINVQSGDRLKIKSNTASSVDAWVSVVQEISS